MSTPADIAAKRGKSVEEILVKVNHMTKTVKVQLVKGLIGTRITPCYRARSGSASCKFGFRIARHPSVRGMINKVSYLVKVVA
jgi:large subunit ribosomal protein L30